MKSIFINNRMCTIGSFKLVKNDFRYYDIVKVLDIYCSITCNGYIIEVRSLQNNKEIYKIRIDDILGDITNVNEEEIYEQFKRK